MNFFLIFPLPIKYKKVYLNMSNTKKHETMKNFSIKSYVIESTESIVYFKENNGRFYIKEESIFGGYVKWLRVSKSFFNSEIERIELI